MTKMKGTWPNFLHICPVYCCHIGIVVELTSSGTHFA